MTASPIAAGPDDLAPAAVRPEPRREREDERQRLRLGHDAEREERRGQRVAALEREHERRQGEQQVDALVLAPPGADVDDRRVEHDDRRGDDRPERPGAEGVDHRAARGRCRPATPGSSSASGSTGPTLSVTVRNAGSMAGQHAPDVGHDGGNDRFWS